MSKSRRTGFTLIEVLIVVVIMAVLAATIIPQFSASTKDAKESTLKFNLQTMQSQMEMYKVHHTGALPTGANNLEQLSKASDGTGAVSTTGAADATHPFGPYMNQMPSNPFNNLTTVKVINTGVAPTTGDSTTGWIYDSSNGKIFPNNPEYYVGTVNY